MADRSNTARADLGSTVVRVFGGMGIDEARGPVSVGGPQQRRLLALLTLRAGTVSSIDWLAEHLWTDDDRPEASGRAIRTYVSRLRQAMPEPARGWLSTETAGYMFDVPPSALEHQRFASLRAQAVDARERSDPLAALQLLDDALELWRGDPFQELEGSEVAGATIEQLKLDRLEVLEERWESALALGRHTQITGELAVFSAEHGLRDRAIRQYALALHRSGRSPEALRVIANHRAHVADESGLQPSPEVVELEQAILANDGSLDVEKIGRPLRGYRLLDEIGSGSFSIVWRAMQPSVGREVAIKQIRSELASQPEFIRRFEAEAQLIARIEHPHIVPLIDFWRDPDSAYLVMRLLRGDTLERRLDDGALEIAEVLRMAHQIGGALAAAHDRGVVHRDVKSGNIMFDESGNAFLGDFGIALEAADSAGPAAAFSTGSPAYSAPEQIRREPLDPRADVFSLGVVLFECIAGSLPFPNCGSAAELVERQLGSNYPPVTERRPEAPRHIADAIAKATSKAPEDRFATIADFIAALGAATNAVHEGGEVPLGLATTLANPYLGLRAFDDADSNNFFGRETLVATLLARLRGSGLTSRCLAVVGPSGSGKSSVVRAGLSPSLRRGAVEGSEQWLATTMVPSDNPFESLEAALLRIAVNPPAMLLDQLHSGKRGILRALRRCLINDAHKIYLVIDQFEELFTRANDRTAREFLSALAVAVEDPRSPLRLVLTLRADYYGHALAHPSFAAIIDQAVVNVTPLSADELERAMVEPAQQLGVRFEPGLVALIVADCIGQPAPLPLLQYTLSELFERRDGGQLTISAYESMGRLAGALATRAEKFHSQAGNAQRLAMRRTFGRLISPIEESADLRRRVPVSDLAQDQATNWVLKKFGDARLLTFDRDASTREPTVEVAHEALLREWPRLITWLEEDRDLLRTASTVAEAATSWDDGGRDATDLYRGTRLGAAARLARAAPDRLRPLDSSFIEASQQFATAEQITEEKRIRRARGLVAGIGVAVVLALMAGGIAFDRQQRASEQAEVADRQGALARESASEAEAQAARANEQADLAQDQAELAQELAQIARQSETKAQAQTQQAELATLISRSGAVSSDDADLAMLLALEAHRRSPTSETQRAVLSALSTGTAAVVATAPFEIGPGAICPHSLTQLQFGVLNGNFTTRDVLTGEVIEYGPTPERCVDWSGSQQLDRRVVISKDRRRVWFGPFDGSLDVEVELAGHIIATGGIHASHRFAILTRQDGVFVWTIFDDRTGEQLRDPIIIDAAQRISARPSVNGKFSISSFYVSPLVDPPSRLLILSMDSGEPVLDIAVPQPFDDVVIDEAAGEAIGIRNGDKRLVTMDLETGKTLASVETLFRTNPDQMSLRPNGLVLVASRNQAQLFDRRTGPVGEPTRLLGVRGVAIRDDGLLQAHTPRGMEILDIDASGLAERTSVIDRPSHVMIQDNLAMVTALDDTGAEIVNLQTGDRQTFVSLTAEGAPAFNIAPVNGDDLDDGVWAISRQGIARWQDDQVVESLRWDLLGPAWGLQRRWYFNQYAHVRELRNGTQRVELFNVTAGALTQSLSVPVKAPSAVHPALDGGLFVVDTNGTLRTYDSDGALVSEVETDVTDAASIALDEDSNQLAVGGDGVSVVDLESNDVTRLPQTSRVTNLGFARAGALLTTSGPDGTLRLWEVASGAFLGVTWTGTGAVQGSAPQNDPTAGTMWFATSGKLIEIPLNPDRWVARACEIVDRGFTQEEWDLYVPGNDPRQTACE